ncbi:MAG: UPF0280 family protein [Deltaproteobacteria bacterium]|nr:UPF0280 family protein [Deltaproteobacteria bacterium]
MRTFRRFSYKDTNLRVACDLFEPLIDEVVNQRKMLEKYIREHGAFRESLSPIAVLENAPDVVTRMAAAAQQTGVGPMAAVAGTLAQMGVERALYLGATESIVENGGDMYIAAASPVTIGIHSGDEKFGDALAFRVPPSRVAICSSSSKMGHSLSFGKCSLATVVSSNASLADAAATLLGNIVQSADDLASAVARVGAIDGVDGVMAIMDGQIGLKGSLPEIVRNADCATDGKITRDRHSLHWLIEN